MRVLLPILLLGPTLLATGEIETREVTYRGGSVQSSGYLAAPTGGDLRPGVLVVHEMWGRNDYINRCTEKLAELGYVALAVDLYGEGRVAHDPQSAKRFELQVTNNSPELVARFQGAMECLQAQDGVDPERIAAVGFSLGGRVVLQMARNGTRGLDGVVALHPCPLKIRPPNPPINKLPAKVLVCNGAESVFLRPGMKDAFLAEMKRAKADLRVVDYPTAMDSFTNPEASKLGAKFNIPLVYDAEAAAAAWGELETFLEDLW